MTGAASRGEGVGNGSAAAILFAREGAAVVVLVAAQRHRGLVHDMLSAPALVGLGRLSYGIYLWHYPVVRYLRADFSWPVVVVLACLPAGLLAWLPASAHTKPGR